MSVPMEIARRVADAVLYEGYLLYPYRASAAKNRVRWQFGVLVPPGFTAGAEPSTSLTECLLERAEGATIHLRLRFLHVRARRVERAEGGVHRPVAELTSGGRTYLTFDEATERETRVALSLAELLDGERTVEVRVPGDSSAEPILAPSGEPEGRVVREHLPLRAALRVGAERQAGPYGLVRLRVRVENTAVWDEPDAPRERALRRSLISAHLIIGVDGGAFLSLTDPPEWARPFADGCRNERAWPVLVGEPGHRDVVLSSPIILSDYPDIAPESPVELFDATEIDEILHLRTLTLTEEETRQARATDPRAARLIDAVSGTTGGAADAAGGGGGRGRRAGEAGAAWEAGEIGEIGEIVMPPEVIERLHGVIRYLGEATRRPPAPWWDPSADAGVSPETDSVTVAGVEVAKGSRVRLVPGKRRADAHDMFLAGRTARVEAVLLDLDGTRHLAVTLEEDPGADLHRSHGRFLYFAPDEVEPLEPAGSATPATPAGSAGRAAPSGTRAAPGGPGDQEAGT